jgi:hypothetical protein
MYHMDPTNCQNKQLAELGKAPATRGGRGTLPHGRLASDASRACHRAQLAQHIAQHAQREMPHALVVPAQQGVGGVTPSMINHFRVLIEKLGALLQQHWGAESSTPYYFGFYDHGVLCNALGQLRTFGSLFMYSTWFLEHTNKWKRFLTLHSSHGGGVGDATSRDSTKQCLRKFLLLTHPSVRGTVADVLARRRGLYHYKGCGQPKYRGHTRTCLAAMRLKLQKLEESHARQVAHTPAPP